MTQFLSLHQALPRIFESPFSKPLNWKMNEGETWTIIGPNGSGKSMFAEVLSGRYNIIEGSIEYPFFEKIKKQTNNELISPKQCIKTISFNSVYSMADFREMYYQQRFNNLETETSPSVSDLFPSDYKSSKTIQHIAEMLGLEKLMNRRLIHLSSGELRKILIARTLLENPQLVIFDNPFIGLDTSSRNQLEEAFILLSKNKIQLIFIVPAVNEIPHCSTHLMTIENGSIVSQEKINMSVKKRHEITDSEIIIDWNTIPSNPESESTEVVEMNNIEISYGKRIINKNINWKIEKGQNWALLGSNGSGKSTLLSYIFADNPQAYSKNLSLFGQKRGTGESIWEIKKRIGFTSSEMHLYYRENVNCLKVVESGFFDTIGLFRKCNEEQARIAEYMFNILNITQLKDRSFLKISSGEQRIVLFARSLVKNPELLILDEPFHGLDDENKHRCMLLVESYAKQHNKSLVFVTHNKEEIPNCVNHFFKLG